MNMRRWLELVMQSVRRNRRDFIFSSIGIVIGIGTLFFFTTLGAGIKQTVLEEVFVIRQLEVVKPTYEIGLLQSEGLFGSKQLDDSTVERLRNIPGVEGVYPKMKLTFPTGAHGGKSLLGQNLWAELIADGIPPSLVGEVDGELAFKDWDAVPCDADVVCADGFVCTDGVCAGEPCTADAAVCSAPAYCNADSDVCEMPIPVVVSPQLLEIYNGSIHTALGGATGTLSKLPKLSEKAIVGFEFDAVFGSSYLGKSASGKKLRRRMRLVGFSDKAIALGATMPIGYVKRLNATFSEDNAAGEYHSILVDTVSNEAVPAVAQAVTDDLGLALSDKFESAQRARRERRLFDYLRRQYRKQGLQPDRAYFYRFLAQDEATSVVYGMPGVVVGWRRNIWKNSSSPGSTQ